MKFTRAEISGVIILLLMAGSIFALNFKKVPGKGVYKLTGKNLLPSMSQTNFKIAPKELTFLLKNDKKSSAFVDLRTPEEFQKDHVKDAIRVDINNIFAYFKKLCKNGNKHIIFYDSTGMEGLAAQAALLYQLNGCHASWVFGGYKTIESVK